MSGKLRIALITDSWKGFPNLALMKLSAWLKEVNNGNLEIDLIKEIPDTAPLEPYDMTYISCVYFQNENKARSYAAQLKHYKIGGSGIGGEILLESIEHKCPDYSLYDIDYSMGFTSRGCPNSCGFCIVPDKEGGIHNHAPVDEFLIHDKVMLLDNNFLASPEWIENLEYINYHKVKVNFNQGLDIRLVTKENAKLLTETKYYSYNFKTRSLHFAFDDLRYEAQFREGIETLIQAGIKPHHIMVYVLIGYNSEPIEDHYRVKVIKSYGCKPYVMTYNQIKSEWCKHYERFINGRYHEFVPFEKYNNGILRKFLVALQESE